MNDYLDFSEKVDILLSASPMDLGWVQRRVEDATIDEDYANNKLRIRRDVRAEIRQAMAEGGVTQTRLAAALGITVQYLNNYLQGMPLPLKYVEEMLFLLDGKMTRE